MSIFNYIKTRITIVDVVNEYTTLKKAGGYWKARCPFHHEKTASFTVSAGKEIFYCFGCHTGGDVIAFIQKIEHCTPYEAAQHLAQRYNIELPSSITLTEHTDDIKKKNRHFDICKQTALWCHEQLKRSPTVCNYLHQRGINDASINHFTIGYFPGGSNSLKLFTQYMQSHAFMIQEIIDAHIIAQGRTTLYSPFEERIIFPISDIVGNYCGFGGRIFKLHDERPKYYNSKESNYFTKGTLLFGLEHAKKYAQETGRIFLVEGYIDCIAMSQHNYPNVVATLGTACTLSHLQQIARYAQYVYIIYDNDSAGNQAVLRLAQLCWQANLELLVVTLPTGEDPASFFARNMTLDQLIKSAQDIFLFFINSLAHDFSIKPLIEKLQVTRKIIELITQVDDALKQDFLLQSASKSFNMPFDVLKQELNRFAHPKISQEHTISQEHAPADFSKLENRIFCAIINNIQMLNESNNTYVIKYLSEPLRTILNKLAHMKRINKNLDFILFFDALDTREQHFISSLLLEHEDIISSQEFENLVLQLQKKQWRNLVHDIKVKLTQAQQEKDDNKVTKILNDFLELKNNIMRINAQEDNLTER